MYFVGNVQNTLWRICKLMLGYKGLTCGGDKR